MPFVPKRNSVFHAMMIAIPLSGALAAGVSRGAGAAELPVPEGIYPYSIVEQDLKVVLREYGQNAGVRVQVSPKVQGTVRGKLPALTARAFLEHLCHVHGLDWYFDGHVLHITPADESAMRVVTLGQVSYNKFLKILQGSEFFDVRFKIAPAADGKSIALAAPPRYIALIEQNVAILNAETGAPPAEPDGRTVIFRGRDTSVVEFGPSGAQVR